MKRIITAFNHAIQPKLCINCKHFIPHDVRWPYEKPNHRYEGRCKMFGQQDLVTGNHVYAYALDMREEPKCGPSAQFYEPLQ